MSHPNPVYRVGDASVTRIDEQILHAFTPHILYPDADPSLWQPHLARLGAGSLDRDTGVLLQSIHTWLLRTPDRVVLVDTATGNNKERPHAPVLHRLNEPFLSRLAEAGVAPDDVDVVLLTHIHGDHVGWNTVGDGDHWTATFPKARYVFSVKEHDYSAALLRGEQPDPVRFNADLGPLLRRPQPIVYADSVMPIVDSGLADIIDVNGREAIEGFAFMPTPGHSIDHASIQFTSRGEEAWFSGDVMHHPLQVYAPELTSMFCEFPEAARRSRLRVLAEAADRGFPVFSSHFAESSVGRVTRDGDGFAWTFL